MGMGGGRRWRIRSLWRRCGGRCGIEARLIQRRAVCCGSLLTLRVFLSSLDEYSVGDMSRGQCGRGVHSP